MKNNSFLKIARKLFLVCSVIFPVNSFSQEQITINPKKELMLDSSFIVQCEKWMAKRMGTRKVFFGPFRIAKADKEKPIKTSHDRTNKGLFWFTSETKKHYPLSLVILYKNTDNVFVNMLYSRTEDSRGRGLLGNAVFGSQDPVQSVWVTCKEMVIDLPGDTSSWHFNASLLFPDNHSSKTDYLGKLINGSDTVFIKYIKGYQTGLMFTKSGTDLAAMQFDRPYIWFSALLDEKTKMLLGSFIAAYLTMKDS